MSKKLKSHQLSTFRQGYTKCGRQSEGLEISRIIADNNCIDCARQNPFITIERFFQIGGSL